MDQLNACEHCVFRPLFRSFAFRLALGTFFCFISRMPTPTNKSSRTLFVVLETREAFLVHFPTWHSVESSGNTSTAPLRIPVHGAFAITTGCFSPDARWIFAGTNKGAVVLINSQGGHVMRSEPFSVGTSMVREMHLDAQGKHMVVNLNDRTVRTFNIAFDTWGTPIDLIPTHKFQDMVGRTPWSGVGFSQDSEYVMGGAAQDTTHNVYIWDRDAGVLVKILEGPNEPLVYAQWHPVKPQVASIASSGDIYLWSTKMTEIWSAYAPGFEELEKNVEYEERENEFDLDELHEDQRQQQEETDFVDLFANGPVPETSLPSMGVPTDLNRSFSTLAADVRRPTTSCSPDMYRDDDDQVAFLIPPLLEDYELGNGKGD